MKRKLFAFVIFVILISLLSSFAVSAASYPIITYMTTLSTPTIVEGDSGLLVFWVMTEYKNEKYHVEIYDSNNRLVADASSSYYNYSTLVQKINLTVDTKALGLSVGQYKIVYWMEFYSLYQWNTAPNKYTGYFKVVENKCQGNHDMLLQRVISESTCEEEGLGHYSCSKCDYEEYVELPKAHNFGTWSTVKSATCTAKGEKMRSCSTCGEEQYETIAMIEHSFGGWKTNTAPTCTAKGEQIRSCSKCSKTETKYVDIIPHAFGEWLTTKDATCTTMGEQAKVCTSCYKQEFREVAIVPHAFGEWTTTKDATCTEKGMEQQNCANCDYAEVRDTEALGHSYETVVTSPTCTEKGYTTYTCHCGDIYTDKHVDATGHTSSEWIVDAEPQINVAGSKHMECEICHEIIATQILEALPEETVPKSHEKQGGCSGLLQSNILWIIVAAMPIVLSKRKTETE